MLSLLADLAIWLLIGTIAQAMPTDLARRGKHAILLPQLQDISNINENWSCFVFDDPGGFIPES